MNRPMSGWNLPPGCFSSDVEKAFGDADEDSDFDEAETCEECLEPLDECVCDICPNCEETLDNCVCDPT